MSPCDPYPCSPQECCERVFDVCTWSDCRYPPVNASVGFGAWELIHWPGQADGLILKSAADLPAICGGYHCLPEECCDEAGTCDQLDCGVGWLPKDKAPEFCEGSRCRRAECCEAVGVCSSEVCVNGTVPLFELPEYCDGLQCDLDECCGERGLCVNSTGEFDCGSGYNLRLAPPPVCNTTECVATECCLQECRMADCGPEHLLKPGALNRSCEGFVCNAASRRRRFLPDQHTCCELGDSCRPSLCPSGLTLRMDLPELCSEAECSVEECCGPIAYCNFDNSSGDASADSAALASQICNSSADPPFSPRYVSYPSSSMVPCARAECRVDECCVPSRAGEMLDPCKNIFGDEVCGVAGCRCDNMLELSCRSPPLYQAPGPIVQVAAPLPPPLDGEGCVEYVKPMCAREDFPTALVSSANEDIANAMLGTSVFILSLLVFWCTLSSCLVREWLGRHSVVLSDNPAQSVMGPTDTPNMRFWVAFKRPWWRPVSLLRRVAPTVDFRVGTGVDPRAVMTAVALRRHVAKAGLMGTARDRLPKEFQEEILELVQEGLEDSIERVLREGRSDVVEALREKVWGNLQEPLALIVQEHAKAVQDDVAEAVQEVVEEAARELVTRMFKGHAKRLLRGIFRREALLSLLLVTLPVAAAVVLVREVDWSSFGKSIEDFFDFSLLFDALADATTVDIASVVDAVTATLTTTVATSSDASPGPSDDPSVGPSVGPSTGPS